MKKFEKELAAKLLEMASDEFANHGCNDYGLENTDENWKMVCAMHKWNGEDPEDLQDRPKKNELIWTCDFLVMSYLAACLMGKA